MFNEKMSFEELSKIYGIEDVDEIYHEMLEKIFMYIPDYRKKLFLNCSGQESYRTILALYCQNYIFLHYLMKMEKQNRKLTEQNQQIIEQNQQVIELLTEIKNK